MTDPAPPDRLVRNAPYEHERGEFDDALLLALDQVNQHGYRDRAEPRQEEGRQERHVTRSW
jgi:hypothetical protein